VWLNLVYAWIKIFISCSINIGPASTKLNDESPEMRPASFIPIGMKGSAKKYLDNFDNYIMSTAFKRAEEKEGLLASNTPDGRNCDKKPT